MEEREEGGGIEREEGAFSLFVCGPPFCVVVVVVVVVVVGFSLVGKTPLIFNVSVSLKKEDKRRGRREGEGEGEGDKPNNNSVGRSERGKPISFL